MKKVKSSHNHCSFKYKSMIRYVSDLLQILQDSKINKVVTEFKESQQLLCTGGGREFHMSIVWPGKKTRVC